MPRPAGLRQPPAAPRRRLAPSALLFTPLLLAWPAFAGDGWSVAAMSAQGVDSDLLQLVPDALIGALRPESSYAHGLIAAAPAATPQALESFCAWSGIGPCKLAWETTALKHSGRQHQYELAGGVRLGVATPAFPGWRHQLSTTQGLSYAFGRPSYEDGSRDDPERRYRLQYHMAFEFETAHESAPAWSLGLRIHHRSGMYGLVAPPRVGSNFVGLVLRYTH